MNAIGHEEKVAHCIHDARRSYLTDASRVHAVHRDRLKSLLQFLPRRLHQSSERHFCGAVSTRTFLRPE